MATFFHVLNFNSVIILLYNILHYFKISDRVKFINKNFIISYQSINIPKLCIKVENCRVLPKFIVVKWLH